MRLKPSKADDHQSKQLLKASCGYWVLCDFSLEQLTARVLSRKYVDSSGAKQEMRRTLRYDSAKLSSSLYLSSPSRSLSPPPSFCDWLHLACCTQRESEEWIAQFARYQH
eukprot:6206718-Pleurochrysis_carterae.AAC.1